KVLPDVLAQSSQRRQRNSQPARTYSRPRARSAQRCFRTYSRKAGKDSGAFRNPHGRTRAKGGERAKVLPHVLAQSSQRRQRNSQPARTYSRQGRGARKARVLPDVLAQISQRQQ